MNSGVAASISSYSAISGAVMRSSLIEDIMSYLLDKRKYIFLREDLKYALHRYVPSHNFLITHERLLTESAKLDRTMILQRNGVQIAKKHRMNELLAVLQPKDDEQAGPAPSENDTDSSWDEDSEM